MSEFYDNKFLSNIHRGYKFCSNYKEGVVLLNPSFKNDYFNDYDLANIFAFDNLIINTDRGGYRTKPNLLIDKTDFIIIDHELTIPFYSNPKSNNINHWNNFLSYKFENHIFYKELKRKRKKTNLFDEFEMNLSNLNLNIFEPIFADLDSFNINNQGYYDCFEYFEWAKNNRHKIIKNLIKRIS